MIVNTVLRLIGHRQIAGDHSSRSVRPDVGVSIVPSTVASPTSISSPRSNSWRENAPVNFRERSLAVHLAGALFAMLTITAMIPSIARCEEFAKVEHSRRYEPTWESLDRHPTPKWFMDAKIGLFVYPPHPTEEQFHRYLSDRGLPDRVFHMAGQSWDSIEWNADEVADLAQQAGARYVVFGVDPHSYFLAYPSKYADRGDSPFVSLRPDDTRKDYVHEIADAARRRGLRFGIYRNYLHPGKNKYFLETTYELIDRYRPETLWLDGDKLSYTADELRSRELAAYYYNNSSKPEEVAIEDALGSYKRSTWGKSLDHGDWFRKELSPRHEDIADGYFVRYETVYRRRNNAPELSRGLVNNLVEWLADATSKNGNLELAIHLGPESLYQFEQRTLQQIGMWLKVNGEAIYDTQPWLDGKPGSMTENGVGVRYTKRDDSLYAILFDWPHGQINLPYLRLEDNTRIQMLGLKSEFRWEQTENGVTVRMPHDSDFDRDEGFAAEIPCDHAFSLKITPKPTWMK